MGRTLVLDLSDRDYLAVEEAARAAGQTAEEWALRNLAGLLARPEGRLESLSPEAQSAIHELARRHGGTPETYARRLWAQIAPQPRQDLDTAEREAARQRLRRHAGAINSGDSRSAENDTIDADLAREYGGSDGKAG